MQTWHYHYFIRKPAMTLNMNTVYMVITSLTLHITYLYDARLLAHLQVKKM